MNTDVTLFRNWRAICAISNPHLFLFVALGKIEEVLNSLSPTLIEHYLTEEKPEKDGPWPLSVIKRIVEESLANEDRPWYEETLEEMCVPLLHYHAASCGDAHDDPWVLVPKGTAEALWEASKQGEAMFVPVVIEGEECLLISLFHGNDRVEPKDGPHTIWGCAIPRLLIDETA